MNLRQKIVVLTGASGGIGQAIAGACAASGARMILVGRNADRLEKVRCGLAGDLHVCVAADLASDAGRETLLSICDEAGRVSILINNAGINDFGMFADQSAASIQALIETNLLSPMLLTHALMPMLTQQAEARVLNVGSTFGSIGYPGYSTYCASKFGLRGFTESLRRELADTDVSVSYIAPRATRTTINSENVVSLNEALGSTMDDPKIVAEHVLKIITAGEHRDKYIGWPEKFFVRVNALLPRLVDSNLRKQLPIIRRFAKSEL